LVRRDTLLAPWLSRGGRLRGRGAQFPGELGHFNGGEPSLKSFVAAFKAGAIDGLLESVAGQYAENYGQARIHLSKLQPTRGFGANVIVMGGFAAQDATDGDKGIVPAGSGKLLGG
jgi:hypothetical protein